MTLLSLRLNFSVLSLTATGGSDAHSPMVTTPAKQKRQGGRPTILALDIFPKRTASFEPLTKRASSFQHHLRCIEIVQDLVAHGAWLRRFRQGWRREPTICTFLVSPCYVLIDSLSQ